jgi:hypothetical protein
MTPIDIGPIKRMPLPFPYPSLSNHKPENNFRVSLQSGSPAGDAAGLFRKNLGFILRID